MITTRVHMFWKYQFEKMTDVKWVKNTWGKSSILQYFISAKVCAILGHLKHYWGFVFVPLNLSHECALSNGDLAASFAQCGDASSCFYECVMGGLVEVTSKICQFTPHKPSRNIWRLIIYLLSTEREKSNASPILEDEAKIEVVTLMKECTHRVEL